MVYFTKFRLLSHLIRLSNQVKSALDAGQPVVALESTVITHGLPFPQNLEVGRALERTVLNEGGIPATIALLNGQIHVGLTERELEQIADPIFKAVKVSSRDIPNVLATVENILYLNIVIF
jgi:pseudouridine-5'-phosphate glycosidase